MGGKIAIDHQGMHDTKREARNFLEEGDARCGFPSGAPSLSLLRPLSPPPPLLLTPTTHTWSLGLPSARTLSSPLTPPPPPTRTGPPSSYDPKATQHQADTKIIMYVRGQGPRFRCVRVCGECRVPSCVFVESLLSGRAGGGGGEELRGKWGPSYLFPLTPPPHHTTH